MSRTLVTLMVVASLLWSGAVRADEPRIAVLPVAGEGVDTSTLSIIEQVLADTLGKAGWSVVATEATAPVAAEACEGGTCWGVDECRAVGVATGTVMVVATAMSLTPSGIEVTMMSVSTVSGEQTENSSVTTLAGLLAATVKLLGETVPEPGQMQPAPPPPEPVTPDAPPEPDPVVFMPTQVVDPVPPQPPEKVYPPCSEWNESWELYLKGKSMMVPGIMLAASGFGMIFLATMFWAVPGDSSGMEPASGGFLMAMGGVSMITGGVLIGFGAKNGAMSTGIWANHTKERLKSPHVECSPAWGDPGFTCSEGRLQSLRATSRGLLIPGAIMTGAGFVFAVADISMALDKHVHWEDESVRVMFAMSTLLGGVGLTLLFAGLGVRKRARELYYNEVASFQGMSVGMAPSGKGAMLGATWSF